MNLAERGVFLSGKIWVRAIRKLTKTGHQTSIIATNYFSYLGKIAIHMMNRWCQENFFKYMREHNNLDRLVDYDLEKISEITRLVNPAYRELDSQFLCAEMNATEAIFPGTNMRLIYKLGSS